MKKGLALLIGMNSVDPIHYQGWDGELKVCEDDAKKMKKLVDKLGFQSELLLTKNATAKNVLDKIDNAAKTLKTGDIFFIYYSGHGGNDIPDINHDEVQELSDEVDGFDESWCLYDKQIIDDILFQRWFKFKAGVRILIISDSCFSGDVFKFLPNGKKSKVEIKGNIKKMPSQIGNMVFKKHKNSYIKFNKSECPIRKSKLKKLSSAGIKASVRLISSSQEYQPSYADTIYYPNNSLFTAILLEIWGNNKFKGDYNQFVKKLKSEMPYDQQPNHQQIGKPLAIFDNQKPFTI